MKKLMLIAAGLLFSSAAVMAYQVIKVQDSGAYVDTVMFKLNDGSKATITRPAYALNAPYIFTFKGSDKGSGVWLYAKEIIAHIKNSTTYVSRKTTANFDSTDFDCDAILRDPTTAYTDTYKMSRSSIMETTKYQYWINNVTSQTVNYCNESYWSMSPSVSTTY